MGQLRRFIEILPDSDELAVGLEAISIWRGNDDWLGLSNPGVVVITAWPRELWTRADSSWAADISDLLQLLQVEVAADAEESPTDGPGVEIAGQVVNTEHVELRWTEPQARGFMLLDVLVHELGHHHGRITSKGVKAPRGEPYAMAYARRVQSEAWSAYLRRFSI